MLLIIEEKPLLNQNNNNNLNTIIINIITGNPHHSPFNISRFLRLRCDDDVFKTNATTKLHGETHNEAQTAHTQTQVHIRTTTLNNNTRSNRYLANGGMGEETEKR